MAAVNTHHIDDESQFLSCEGDVLLLEGALLRLVRPAEVLEQVHTPDHADDDTNDLPSDRLAQLKFQCIIMYMYLN